MPLGESGRSARRRGAVSQSAWPGATWVATRDGFLEQSDLILESFGRAAAECFSAQLPARPLGRTIHLRI